MYLQFVFMYLNTVIEIDQEPKSISIYKAITYLHPYFLSTYIYFLCERIFQTFLLQVQEQQQIALLSSPQKKAHVAL